MVTSATGARPVTKTRRHLDSSNEGRSSAFVRTSAAAGVVTLAALMTAFTGGAASASTVEVDGADAVVVQAAGEDYVPEQSGVSVETPSLIPADAPAADPAVPADGLAVTGADAGLIAGLAGLFIAGGAVITIAGSAARRRTARAKG
ncbi:hypothetical protein ELQ90_11705 [Labedella phragmitis]|uniref:LPXTG cell wall anchor domain-containing protein n=1 Tax=Labedella phragmitis TaxID=2498849 RepID=A0A3S5CE08_9MICO|nr:hypothetical protein [Labedella phragmitis]RWZ50002.1 hypothetical protein ELQ90_11705 [Labedella phragmitis]